MDSLTPEIPTLSREAFTRTDYSRETGRPAFSISTCSPEVNCFCELPDAVPGPVLDPGVLGLLRKLRWGSHSVCEGREF